jgi:dTDP-4-dehydrorhamnose 3,5-epimerase
MRFTECSLRGAFVVDIAPAADERGFFARSYCEAEFAAQGLAAPTRQCSLSYNARLGTLRGMHYQHAPHEEEKLVRCTAGAVFDVIVDLRPRSPTRFGWCAVELSAANRRALYVPKGFAHGFLSLCDDTEVFYMISAEHAAGAVGGLRWNDPLLAIRWPFEPAVISARDAAFPPLDPGRLGN